MSENKTLSRSIHLLRIMAIVLCLILLFAWQIEKKLIFIPFSNWSQPLPEGAQKIEFSSADGIKLSGAWFPAEGTNAVIVQCHGNAGNISHRFDIASHWQEQGWSVLLFDYRGYGHSAGNPTEAGIITDARAALSTARNLSEKDVIIYGRSLGTVAAIAIASEPAVRGLILDSPLLNGAAMANTMMPLPGLGLFMQSPLNNSGRIGSITCPVLLLHGDADEVVPYQHAVELYRLAPEPKQLLTIPGGRHNDQRLNGVAFETVKNFISELANQ